MPGVVSSQDSCMPQSSRWNLLTATGFWSFHLFMAGAGARSARLAAQSS